MLRKGDFGYCDIRYNPLNDHSHGLHALLQQFTPICCIHAHAPYLRHSLKLDNLPPVLQGCIGFTLARRMKVEMRHGKGRL